MKRGDIMIPEHLQEMINNFSNQCFVIEELMESEDKYSDFTDYIYDCIKAGFEYKELRECPVYFRFHPNTDINTMQLRHFLTNLFFWEPAIVLSAVDEFHLLILRIILIIKLLFLLEIPYLIRR